MATVEVYNLQGKSVGTVELANDVFGAEVNEDLLYEIVKAQRASSRQGTACSKTRSEVRGSTRKIYRQKGTGRARHGSIRAPIFVGGGKAHGPKPRSFAYRPPRKMRVGALKSALALKLRDAQLVVVEDLNLESIKTKALFEALGFLKAEAGALLVDERGNEKLRLSARNLPRHQFLPPEGVNVYDLLRYPHLVVSRAALGALEARCKA